MSEFGNKFRKEREKQGISLDDVANATKIGSRMLRAIEDEQFDHLPGGVFNKGFIRAYAKHLGMNDDEAVAGYLACLRRAQSDSRASNPPTRSATRESAPPSDEELPDLQLPRAEHVRPPRREYLGQRDGAISWRILALVVLVVVLAGILWHRHWRSARTAAGNVPPPPTAAQSAIPPSKPSAPPAANAPPGTSASHAGAAPVRPSPPHAPVPNSRSVVLTSTVSPATAGDIRPAANLPEENVPASVAPAQEPAPLSLVIRASENSWISVSADGRNVIHELLIAPAHANVHAAREIVLKVGNAAGVTFLWNGQEFPAPGAEAEVVTLVFDASGMRVLPASQEPTQNR